LILVAIWVHEDVVRSIVGAALKFLNGGKWIGRERVLKECSTAVEVNTKRLTGPTCLCKDTRRQCKCDGAARNLE